MEYFFDADKPHWPAWSRVQMVDVGWHRFKSGEGVNGALPLYYASLGGFYDLAERLVGKHPEHVNARGGLMVVPLVAALHQKHYQIAGLLHRYGADVNVRDEQENTPLCQACDDGLLNIVQWLLNHGADVNAQGFLRRTPLHVATDNVLQILLDYGADPTARDNNGSTPLHFLTWSIPYCTSSRWEGYYSPKGKVEATRLLLDHGAISDAEDNEGRTALHLALENGRHDIAACLTERGGCYALR